MMETVYNQKQNQKISVHELSDVSAQMAGLLTDFNPGSTLIKSYKNDPISQCLEFGSGLYLG